MLDEGQGLRREEHAEDRAGIGRLGLREIGAVVLRLGEGRIGLAHDGPATGEEALLEGCDIFTRRHIVGGEQIDALGRVLRHPHANGLGDLRAGIGGAEHIAVALVAGERIGRGVRQNERDFLARQIGADRQGDGGIDDAGRDLDLVGAHELAGLLQADGRIALRILMQQFDLAPGDGAAKFLDGESHALELTLAKHRKDPGRRHEDADLQGSLGLRRS